MSTLALLSALHFVFATGPLSDEQFRQLWEIVKGCPDPALMIGGRERKYFERAWHLSFRLMRKVSEREEILAYARRVDRLGIPFYFQVYNPAGPTVNPDTAAKILRLPRCRGLVLSEAWNGGTFEADWCWSLALAFVEQARKAGKKVLWIEHYSSGPYTHGWHHYHGFGWLGFCVCCPEIFDLFFRPRYRDTIVPMFETNECGGTPDLMALFGWWLSGLCREWGWSVQSWYWEWAWGACIGLAKSRGWREYLDIAKKFAPLPEEWPVSERRRIEVCNRHPPSLILRTLIEAVSLGATYFQFEPRQMIFEHDGEVRPARQFVEGIRPFVELWRRGLVLPPRKPEEIETISPVAFLATREGARIVKEGRVYSAQELGPFSYWHWGKRALDDFFPHYGFREVDFYDSLVLRTPYGMVPILPPNAPRAIVKRFDFVLVTNLGEARLDGRKLSTSEILAVLERARGKMRFRAEDVFLSVVKGDGSRWMCYLLDPREVDAKGPIRTALLLPKGKWRAVEALTGRRLTVEGGKVDIEVPPEGFTILVLEKGR